MSPIVGAAARSLRCLCPLLVIVHAQAGTVWNGGHLVLDLGVLPRALRAQSAAQMRACRQPGGDSLCPRPDSPVAGSAAWGRGV